MAGIEITDLTKNFGEHSVLKGIDLSVAEGEFIALVGPSGCGKSTLLRIIAGLEQATSGSIAFDGKAIDRVPPQARNIAMVFQSYALYPHMTVRQNMAFGLKRMKLPTPEIAARIERTAAILDLAAYLDRLPKQLSGGQRQRVAMGRAIVREPSVFLLDEPLSNLDAQLRVSMRGEIRELQERLRVTTIYVTHDQVEAITMADRIVLMNDGEIMQIDRPLDLYDRPANLFVARFIGSPEMNLLAGERVAEGIRLGGGTVLPIDPALAHAAGRLVAGIRPEHLTITIDPAARAHTIEGVVRHLEALGSETEIRVEACGQRLCVRHFGRRLPAVGDRVWLEPALDRLHLFEGGSGRRISESRQPTAIEA